MQGLPLLMMEETRKGQENVKEIMRAGAAGSATAVLAGRQVAKNTKSSSRRAFIEGLSSGASTLSSALKNNGNDPALYKDRQKEHPVAQTYNPEAVERAGDTAKGAADATKIGTDCIERETTARAATWLNAAQITSQKNFLEPAMQSRSNSRATCSASRRSWMVRCSMLC